MSRRKHISWKTKCAAALLHAMRDVAYDDAKKMTEDQFLSLFQWDHNMLHAFEGEDRDSYYNLTPMLIMAHRRKTKADAKIIAKSKRIRAKNKTPEIVWKAGPTIGAYWMGPDGFYEVHDGGKLKRVSKIRSRGFDKRYRKKMSGKVVKR